ncbi:MAG: START domain-containing protein [Thermoanaerobaculia bacterium]
MALFILAAVAQLAFTFSGSGQWESLGEKDGIHLYVKKTPGKNIKEYKAVWKIRSTMNRFVAFAKTEDSDLQVGYYDIKDLETPSEQVVISSWKQKFPEPFKPREFVVKNEFTQDPATKTLVFRVTAEPDKAPEDDCCVRVPEMDNSWTVTPLRNGEMRVEWVSDLDMGGFLPYFTLNAFQPGGMRFFAKNVQKYLDQPRYATVKYAWIQEP